jgi:hypothetical protein
MIETAVYQNVISILQKFHISYVEIEHPPVFTCVDSAIYRQQYGWTGLGSKNILFHAKGHFYLVVTSADKEIKARMFKKEFGSKNTRFATIEEVMQVTGCAIGAMPSFGYMNTVLPIYRCRNL